MFTRGNVAIFFVAGWLTIFSNNILESFSRPSETLPSFSRQWPFLVAPSPARKIFRQPGKSFIQRIRVRGFFRGRGAHF